MNGRRGFALPIVLSVSAVLGAMVFALFQYQSQTVWVTGATVNDLSALAAAEAGVGCVLAEIQVSPRFATHELDSFDPEGNPVWGTELRRPQALAPREGLALEKGSKGTYRGSVGEPPYQAHFRVRAGYVPAGLTGTPDADRRSRRHLLIEAMGFRQDPTRRQDRATRVRLLVERSNFTEFLLYDGEWATLGMGSGDDPDEANVFADGRIYGHRWVHLGNISGGTRQRFVNLSSIRSAGKILAWDPYRITFQGDPDPSGAVRPEGQFAVDFGPAVDSDGPSPLETASGRILDGDHGGEIPSPRLDAKFFREQIAQGIDLDATKTAVRADWRSYPEFDGKEVVVVDFGLAPAPGRDGDDGREEGLGVAYPRGFNGLVLSSRPVVVRGAPDRELTLVCLEDIFVAGDLNSRASHPQDYSPGYRPRGDGEVIRDARYYDYVVDERFLDDAGEKLPPEEAGRTALGLISLGRVWRDYRLPGHGLANELAGLLGFELGLAMARFDPSTQGLAGEDYRRRAEEIAGGLVSTGSPPGGEIQVPGYEGGPPPSRDADGDGAPDLPAGLWDLGSMFPVSKPDGEDPGDPAFRVSPTATTGDPTIQEVLRGPVPEPHYWSSPKAPYYWTRWAVTAATKARIHEVLNERLGAARGKLTPEVLFGPHGDDGLTQALISEMIRDEEAYADHPGMGFFGGIPPASTSRLALANAPQRLYELVRDEPDASGEPGRFSDQAGRRTEMQRDRLYLPQVTINAMLFDNAPKNDANVPGGNLSPGLEAKEADPTRVDRRFLELGNPRNQGLHYLTTLRTMRGERNIRSPFIQRLRGSQIRFARGAVREPQTRTGFYWPPIRRRIFDQDLLLHPPPGLPSQTLIKSWENRGATRREFDRF